MEYRVLWLAAVLLSGGCTPVLLKFEGGVSLPESLVQDTCQEKDRDYPRGASRPTVRPITNTSNIVVGFECEYIDWHTETTIYTTDFYLTDREPGPHLQALMTYMITHGFTDVTPQS